ncbi:hypothetical protein [Mesorhizobium sp. GR13]|uniref:hypothetical protein n=1 Tax=Mesorhizobium sp. GR13 TaxID=2562308 RepID=UPI0014856F9D|nr:hypothetical protein [Mesorhizobium sp. GR13]
MGMVLSFVPRTSASSQRQKAGELAPVIIFPGVRYERIKAEDKIDETQCAAVQKPAH